MESIVLPVGDKLVRVESQNGAFLNKLAKEFFSNPNKNSTVYKKVNVDDTLAKLHKKVPRQLKRSLSSIRYKAFILTAFLERSLFTNNIFFLHGSSFVKNGVAFVFVGPSGMGKTTIIKNIKRELRLSNDTCVIKMSGKSFHIYSSPFDKGFVTFQPNKFYPLKRVYVLRQGKQDSVKKLSFNRKIAHLIFNSPYFMNYKNIQKIYGDDAKVAKKLLGLFHVVTKQIEIEELTFTKNCSFLQTLV